jgi:hypothetical protein
MCMHLYNYIWVVLLVSRLNLAFLSPKLSRGIDKVLVCLCPCGFDNPRNTLRWKMLQLAFVRLQIILLGLTTTSTLVARLTLVRNAHNIEGSSLCPLLPLASRSWNIIAFTPCNMSPFAHSTWSFIWGYAADEAWWLIMKYVQHLANFAPLNWVPLFVKTHFETPNLYMIFYKNLNTASWVMFTTSIASIHFVNVSIETNKNINPPGALGKMLTISIP